MKILIYNAQTQSKIFSLQHVLKDIALKGTGITLTEVTADDLREKLTADVALLILPGARAGTTYREQLQGKNFDLIRQRIEAGMHVLGICAGAFVLAKEFDYDDGDLHKHIHSELGIAAVKAFGPDMRLYPSNRPREEGNPWSVYTAAEVKFTAGGKSRKASLALSKGPSFIHLDRRQCTAFATYTGTGDAAIVRFKHGKGGGMLSGPALEVGGDNLKNYIHPDHYEDPYCRNIINALESSSAHWAALWVEALTTLLPHNPEVHAQIRRNFGLEEKKIKGPKI